MSDNSVLEKVLSARPAGPVEPCAAGTTVRGVREAMEAMVGADVVARALEKVPRAVREAFEPLTPLTWVPISAVETVAAQVARDSCRVMDDFMDEVVRRAADQMFRTSWRILLRLTSDEALIARAPVLYAKWRNIGQLVVGRVDPGRAEIVLSDWPGVTERQVRTLAVSIEMVLRLSGRRWVKLEWQLVEAGANYVATWRP